MRWTERQIGLNTCNSASQSENEASAEKTNRIEAKLLTQYEYFYINLFFFFFFIRNGSNWCLQFSSWRVLLRYSTDIIVLCEGIVASMKCFFFVFIFYFIFFSNKENPEKKKEQKAINYATLERSFSFKPVFMLLLSLIAFDGSEWRKMFTNGHFVAFANNNNKNWWTKPSNIQTYGAIIDALMLTTFKVYFFLEWNYMLE